MYFISTRKIQLQGLFPWFSARMLRISILFPKIRIPEDVPRHFPGFAHLHRVLPERRDFRRIEAVLQEPTPGGPLAFKTLF
jgi:hypothetical protein